MRKMSFFSRQDFILLFLWNELRFKRSITFLWNKFSILATKLKLKELISIFKIKEGGIEKEFRFF